jgi:general secretion pathway protein F
MPVYQYKGLRTDGKQTVGIVDAESVRSARLKLRKDGLYPTEIAETQSSARLKTQQQPAGLGKPSVELSGQELALFTRQLGTLLVAGLPLVDALGVLVDQMEKKVQRSWVADVREQIREGHPLSQAFEQTGANVPEVYIHMVRAGEASGALDAILLQLADFLDAQLALKQRITNAALYPALMLAVAVTVLFFLMTFVVPKITGVFADMHQALPLPTHILMVVSRFCAETWWLWLIGAGLAIAGVRRSLQTPHGRKVFDRLLLRTPGIGHVVRLVAISRLTGTLATMLHNGVHLLEALEVAKRVMRNSVLEEAVEIARQNIREGDSIAEPLKRSGEFPALVTHMIAVGEKSGELEEMLRRVTHIYTREVERLTTRVTALLEPLMILAMGVVVFAIVVAILLPIFEMSEMVR